MRLLQVLLVLSYALLVLSSTQAQATTSAWSTGDDQSALHSSTSRGVDASINLASPSSVEFIEVDSFDTDQLDLVTEPCPSGCNSKGVCTQDGQCYCYDGWTGPDCSSRICPNACHLHGTCENGVCKCNPGWAGYDCSFRGCPDDCSGHGACHIGPFASECVCFAGYTGDRCEISISSLNNKVGCKDDCSGHGVCVNNTKCACEQGYVGAYCQQRDCERNCHGRGLCNPEKGECMCFDEQRYGGKFCEIAKCPNQCNGHGECLPSGACKCEDGYFGIDCHPKNCRENCNYPNGKCVLKPQNETITDPKTGEKKTILSMARARGVCECHAMFKGDTCDASQCPHDCSGNGTCDPTSLACTCKPGWTGEACNLKACPHKCVHGHCFDGKCVCSANWKGEDCSEAIPCPSNCSGHGTCLAGKCYCKEGFAGKACNMKAIDARKAALDPVIKIAPAVSDPLGCKPACVKDQGICILDERNQYVCRCVAGAFTGADCSVKVSEKTPATLAEVATAPVQSGMVPLNASVTCNPPCARPGGHCVQIDPKRPPSCLCDFGFAGLTCATKTGAKVKAEAKPEKKSDDKKEKVETKEAKSEAKSKTSDEPAKKSALLEDHADADSLTSATSNPALMEVAAMVDDGDLPMYADTEAAQVAAALLDDQREDAMLLEALDQLIDY